MCVTGKALTGYRLMWVHMCMCLYVYKIVGTVHVLECIYYKLLWQLWLRKMAVSSQTPPLHILKVSLGKILKS